MKGTPQGKSFQVHSRKAWRIAPLKFLFSSYKALKIQVNYIYKAPVISRKVLIDKLMKSINLSDFKNFIRNFSFFILEERKKVLEDFKSKFGYSWPEKPNFRQIVDLETLLGDAIVESHN